VDTEEGATMRWEMSMEKRKRRKFTDEFKREAVRLVKQGDGNVSQVARDLDLSVTALRKWVKQDAIDRGKGPAEALSTAERDELQKLRRRVRTLEEEREILKKAAAFFAKESK
jgi:transposase